MTFNNSSVTEDFYGAFHVVANVDAERATSFAHAALNALARVMSQRRVMFAHSFGHSSLSLGKVQKFRDGGNVDFFDARRTVTAINAMPLPTDFREARESQRVIFFSGGGSFVSNALLELLKRRCAGKYNCDGGTT